MSHGYRLIWLFLSRDTCLPGTTFDRHQFADTLEQFAPSRDEIGEASDQPNIRNVWNTQLRSLDSLEILQTYHWHSVYVAFFLA